MERHCCEDMRREVERVCVEHPDRLDCPDCLLHYSSRFREYGLIVHDGGSSSVGIRFCPWCGARLPESLRDRWFEELEALGIDPSRNEQFVRVDAVVSSQNCPPPAGRRTASSGRSRSVEQRCPTTRCRPVPSGSAF